MSEVEDDLSFVLYGRSATGKTTLAGTFPKPLLHLDVRDRGTRSISDVKGIKVRKIVEFAEFEDTIDWLRRHPDTYKTAVIDTVSQLQQVVVKEKMGDGGRNNRIAGDWGSMTKRDWGDVAALMKESITSFRDLQDLGMNIVFIAQDRVFNFDDEAETETEGLLMPEVGPALSPSIVRVLNASVSMIGNTLIRVRYIKKKGEKREQEKIDYCLRIGPNPVYTTKVRKPRGLELPQVIVDPTYEDILSIMQGE